jgi:hypothetical protein
MLDVFEDSALFAFAPILEALEVFPAVSESVALVEDHPEEEAGASRDIFVPY